MNAIIVFLIIDTLLQLKLCHFSLWWIISVVCRICFCLRIIGVTFNIRKLAIVEAFNFGAMFLFNSLFHKDGMPWLKIIFYIITILVAVGLEYLDEILYVYVIEDADDE